MLNSLLNQFSGAWLGALLGESLGYLSQQHQWDYQVQRSDGLEPLSGDLPRSLRLGRPNLEIARSTSQELAWLAAEAFLKGGQKSENWQAHWSGIWPGLNHPEIPTSLSSTGLSVLATDKQPILEAALLPMILFHHEDLKLWDFLHQQLAHLLLLPPQVDRVVWFTWLVQKGLQKRWPPERWLLQLLAEPFPSLGSTPPVCPAGFQILQNCLSQPHSLETMAKSLTIVEPTFASLLWALYCFLTAPNNVRLCLLRACQNRAQPVATATLAGAIAGAYNGIKGIPIAWLTLLPPTLQQSLLDLNYRLFTQWCGILVDPTQLSTTPDCDRLPVRTFQR